MAIWAWSLRKGKMSIPFVFAVKRYDHEWRSFMGHIRVKIFQAAFGNKKPIRVFVGKLCV